MKIALNLAKGLHMREAVNAISNAKRKPASDIFLASNIPTGITLLSQLPDIHSKVPQQGDPY